MNSKNPVTTQLIPEYRDYIDFNRRISKIEHELTKMMYMSTDIYHSCNRNHTCKQWNEDGKIDAKILDDQIMFEQGMLQFIEAQFNHLTEICSTYRDIVRCYISTKDDDNDTMESDDITKDEIDDPIINK